MKPIYICFLKQKRSHQTPLKALQSQATFYPKTRENFDKLTNAIKRDKRHLYRIYKTTLGKVGKIIEMSVIDFSTILISNMVCAAPQALNLA